MKKSRFTDSQVIDALKRADRIKPVVDAKALDGVKPKPANNLTAPRLNRMGCGHMDDALRAPISAMDNSDELPTTPIFVHMPTAHHRINKNLKADISI